MASFETFQKDKTLTASGGAGSLIQTRENGSILVSPFDQWPIYRHPNKMQLINDSRLRKLLRDRGYANIQGIFSVPENEVDRRNNFRVADTDKLLSGKYFPEWFFCPYCRRFKPISRWRQLWNRQFNTDFDIDYPCCCHCSNRRRKVRLEQVRFILIDKNYGNLKDIPWNQYLSADGTNVQIDDNDNINDNIDDTIEYSTSGSISELGGITIRSGYRNRRRTLSPLFETTFTINGIDYSVVLRGGSNVYFPQRLSSIYVPIEQPTLEDLKMIRNFQNMPEGGRGASIIYLGQHYQHPEEMYERLVAAHFELHAYTEDMVDFRKEEYDYIINEAGINDPDFIRYPLPHFAENIQTTMDIFKQIYIVKKLKETSLLIGYKRGSEDCRLHPCCSGNADEITYYPAIEKYGEGIFFQLDVNNVFHLIGTDVQDEQRLEESKVFMHSLSHAIMKELENECGYPLTSIRERLYINEHENINPYLGFMLYTVNGEASLGGMTDYVAPKLKDLLFNAITRGTYCPHDPICEHDTGHCFACLDIPEISCDGEMNPKLNRKYLKKLTDYMEMDGNIN